MNRYLLTFLFFLASFNLFAAVDAQYGFEGVVPSFVRVNGKGSLTLSADKFKDGKTSVRFDWNGPAQLMFSNFADIEAAMKADGGGMILWIYNPVRSEAPLLFKFHDWNGQEICHFEFNMNFTGWRTIWMKFEDMLGPDGRHLGYTPLSDRNVAASRMTVSVPQSLSAGTIYFDRLSFLKYRMQDQIVPDMQIPDNNHIRRSRLWQ